MTIGEGATGPGRADIKLRNGLTLKGNPYLLFASAAFHIPSCFAFTIGHNKTYRYIISGVVFKNNFAYFA